MAKAKPQHINLSTEPADIIATMAAEMSAVRYHKRKAYGGTRKYELWKEQLKERALQEKKNQMSDITEWISNVGNRWVMYSFDEYLPKVDRVLPCHAAFIYYETLNSCGAFFPCFPQGSQKPNGVAIFTSHFFQRLSERANIPYRSKAMIQEFISSNFMRSISSQDKVGGEAYMRFRCGYGIGVVRSTEPYVVEVRTFLTDEQLSPSQRKRMKIADIDARIIELLGDAAGKETLQMLERIGYYFCKLAEQWNGFNPKDYTSREILVMVAESLPPTYFDWLMDDSKMLPGIGEKIVSDTCDTMIRMADSLGYEGWTHDRIQQAMVELAKDDDV
jgi:hypothetical protein